MKNGRGPATTAARGLARGRTPDATRDAPERASPTPTLGTAYMARALPRLEAALEATLHDPGQALDGLSDAMADAVGTGGRGGRRWRPLLTMAAAEASGASSDDVLSVAVAVELTHTASLVLDDMPCMDDSAERRGRPSAHLLVGPAGAILLSVGLLARAAEALAEAPRGVDGVCRDWGRTFGLAGMAGGQAVDLSARGPQRGALRRLHREKSTALSAFAVSAGARVAGASAATRLGLFRFGRDLGWAYQLADDAADREEDAALGRPPGGRNPGVQSDRLLRRGLRVLGATPGLDAAGVRLLASLAVLVVPGGSDSPAGDAAC